MSPRGRRHGDRGFTLVELLLGLVVLAMTLAIAFAALRFSARSLERTDVLVREMEEIRVAGDVVQGLLSQVRPLMRDDPQRQTLFRGESQAVEFVAPVPSQQGRLAGLYHYRLRIASDAQGVRLMLDHQPYIPSGHFDWSEGHESVLLVQGLAGGGFSYFGYAQAEEPEGWSAHWPVAESLPILVRLQLERGPGRPAWPEMVVPLRANRVR